MFNTNKTKKTVSNSTNQSPSVNIINEGTKIKGNIHANSDIRVSGTVVGEAISKGKIILTNNGEVKGNVSSADADIAGKVEGDVKVNSRLILRKEAIIDGNIYTKSLVVEEGAQINGTCKMGTDVKNLSQHNDADYAEETKLKGAQA
jgi:cytoskeletal protein CcmA (bactofilin family)